MSKNSNIKNKKNKENVEIQSGNFAKESTKNSEKESVKALVKDSAIEKKSRGKSDKKSQDKKSQDKKNPDKNSVTSKGSNQEKPVKKKQVKKQQSKAKISSDELEKKTIRSKNVYEKTFQEKPIKEKPSADKTPAYKNNVHTFNIWEHKGLILLFVTILAFFMLVAGIANYLWTKYQVNTIYVDGNIHYSDEEIVQLVTGDSQLAKNSLYLSLKYRDRGIDDIPFVETIDITIADPNTVRINVYEKTLAGYVQYLGRYMYFDKDGIIVETSEEPSSDVPQVTGLIFSHVILHEKLPVEDDRIFQEILNMTQLLSKNDIEVDKIYFDENFNVSLMVGDVKVLLGSDNMDDKLLQLDYILPELIGKKGTLDMENYDNNTNNITFMTD